MVVVPPATGSALIILVAFVLPGFVTVLIQERTFKRAEDPTTLDRLLRILYYSIWSYLLLAIAGLVFGVDRAYVERLYMADEGNPAELVWRGALLVLVPSLVIATATRAWAGSRPQGWVMRLARVNERHEEPTAWDYFFRQRRGAYVRVTFKDGGRILGYYGSNSFAAYAKDDRDLFLECVYAPTAEFWFGERMQGSEGVWIDTQEAVSVEFYTDRHAASAPPIGDTASSETSQGNGPPAAEGPAAGAAAPTTIKERILKWPRRMFRRA
jgi:Family of unknown function (DUF6338)